MMRQLFTPENVRAHIHFERTTLNSVIKLTRISLFLATTAAPSPNLNWKWQAELRGQNSQPKETAPPTGINMRKNVWLNGFYCDINGNGRWCVCGVWGKSTRTQKWKMIYSFQFDSKTTAKAV